MPLKFRCVEDKEGLGRSGHGPLEVDLDFLISIIIYIIIEGFIRHMYMPMPAMV